MLNKVWVTDPKNSKKSVSLTLLLWSFLICMFCTLFGGSKFETSSLTIEIPSLDVSLFLTSAGLYFGRRNINFNKKEENYGSDISNY